MLEFITFCIMAQMYSNELTSLEQQIEKLDVFSSNTREFDLEFLYDVDKCKSWIEENNLKRICLQFPDYLLCDSAKVIQLFESTIGIHMYVLGDTSYESCCVDYVAAAHITADGIIHFGSTCFSTPNRSIPTLMVFEKTMFDLDKLFNAFVYQFHDETLANVSIVLDTQFLYKKEQMELIRDIHPEITLHGVDEHDLNFENRRVLYIGDDNRKLAIFNIIFKPMELFYYNNKNPEYIQSYAADTRAIKRRAYLQEVIKDSQTVGIIMGTVAVKNYKVIMHRMVKLCKLHKKKYYLLSVGKPTVAKLANFPELDVYVLISCPMNEIFDSRDFYKPIVTPYDVEIALNPTPKDFIYHNLTSLADNNDDLNDVTLNVCDVSLLTGMVRNTEKDTGEDDQNTSSSVAIRGDGVLVQSKEGAGFLCSRSWKGLEPSIGQSVPELAKEGRKGIAAAYETEPKTE